MVGQKIQKCKKNHFWKKWKKNLVKHKQDAISKFLPNYNFLTFSRIYSFNLYHHFFWENSRTWDFLTQSLDMRGLDPFRVQSNLANKTWTTHTNRLFECVNHIFFYELNRWKKTTASNYLYFWSYGPICSYFWVLPPFMAMLSDHNSWTTDPNFMFLSIFRNVLRCLTLEIPVFGSLKRDPKRQSETQIITPRKFFQEWWKTVKFTQENWNRRQKRVSDVRFYKLNFLGV